MQQSDHMAAATAQPEAREKHHPRGPGSVIRRAARIIREVRERTFSLESFTRVDCAVPCFRRA